MCSKLCSDSAGGYEGLAVASIELLVARHALPFHEDARIVPDFVILDGLFTWCYFVC